jgi:hypothetical protein
VEGKEEEEGRLRKRNEGREKGKDEGEYDARKKVVL